MIDSVLIEKQVTVMFVANSGDEVFRPPLGLGLYDYRKDKGYSVWGDFVLRLIVFVFNNDQNTIEIYLGTSKFEIYKKFAIIVIIQNQSSFHTFITYLQVGQSKLVICAFI